MQMNTKWSAQFSNVIFALPYNAEPRSYGTVKEILIDPPKALKHTSIMHSRTSNIDSSDLKTFQFFGYSFSES